MLKVMTSTHESGRGWEHTLNSNTQIKSYKYVVEHSNAQTIRSSEVLYNILNTIPSF